MKLRTRLHRLLDAGGVQNVEQEWEPQIGQRVIAWSSEVREWMSGLTVEAIDEERQMLTLTMRGHLARLEMPAAQCHPGDLGPAADVGTWSPEAEEPEPRRRRAGRGRRPGHRSGAGRNRR